MDTISRMTEGAVSSSGTFLDNPAGEVRELATVTSSSVVMCRTEN